MAFGLFKKKKTESPQEFQNRYFDLTISEVVEVGKDALNLVFENPGSEFTYQPGQFLTIIDKVNDKKIRRAYSLCSSPAWEDKPAVTVKRVEGGLMSNHINDAYEAGQTVEVMEPMGMFTTSYSEDQVRKITLIAGGSGITPLFSIMKSLLKEEPKTSIDFVYANRSEEYIIFKNELAKLSEEYQQLSLYHILEEASDVAKYTGRPDAAMATKIALDLSMDGNSEVFICGPQPMMDVFQDGLKSAGIEDSQVHIESFEAGKTAPSTVSDTSEAGDESEVTIVVNGESFELTKERKIPLLEQALEKNIDMPYSCQSGLCTACRGKCVEGDISVDEVMGLSENELKDRYVLTCVGKALTDRVKVEIG
ncbi:MAG: FAD-binding oxidoreductase [Cyclobacteriaceae bacterium]